MSTFGFPLDDYSDGHRRIFQTTPRTFIQQMMLTATEIYAPTFHLDGHDTGHDLSDGEKQEMEVHGFVHPGADHAVYWAIHQLRLVHRPIQYHFPFHPNMQFDPAVMDAMARMATDFAYAHSVMDMIIMYMGCHIKTAVWHLVHLPTMAKWPVNWYSNLCIDMSTLDCLIPISVTQNCYQPPLPTLYILHHMGGWTDETFCNTLSKIPESQMSNTRTNVMELLPQWTPHLQEDGGFVFPWWLTAASNYASAACILHSDEVQHIVQKYFRDIWPLDKSPIKDRLHGALESHVECYKNNVL
ncbi:hypothetical protein BKA82DRAFT_4018325 [Pisolithus tinctorius]|nr:hypothetical protein BKA82DRAFT_4018325 [Pisolithus tinctorius]